MQLALAGVCQGSHSAAVPTEMFCTSQGLNELMPRNDSQQRMQLQPPNSTEKSQHPPLPTLSKQLGPAPEEATALPLLHRTPGQGEGVFPMGAAKKTTQTFCVERHPGAIHLPSPPRAAGPLGGCVPTDSELIKSCLSSTVDTEASRLACSGRAAAKSSFS